MTSILTSARAAFLRERLEEAVTRGEVARVPSAVGDYYCTPAERAELRHLREAEMVQALGRPPIWLTHSVLGTCAKRSWLARAGELWLPRQRRPS